MIRDSGRVKGLLAGAGLLAALILGPGAADARGQDVITSLPPRIFTTTEYFFRRDSTEKVQPEYPAEAQQAGIEGTVLVFVVANEEGKIVEVKPLVSPHQLLTDAVVKAVKEWRTKKLSQFDPVYLDWGELRFVFSLQGGEAAVLEAPREVQMLESKEHYQERLRRMKKP